MMKLYVWEGQGTLQDWSSGMICVLAHNLEEALRLIAEKDPATTCKFNPTNYQMVDQPEAFVCWGGG